MFDREMLEDEVAGWLSDADHRDAEVGWEKTRSVAPDSLEPRTLAELGDLEPGILLAALLSSVDINTLAGHDRVIVMGAHQRMASHFQAQVYASMASVADAVAEELQNDGETDFELAVANSR